jgi:putative phosphoesterase
MEPQPLGWHFAINQMPVRRGGRALQNLRVRLHNLIVTKERNPKTIGLISDTHGLLRPQALRALEGSDMIIHAGDVGDPEILETLKTLAPVFAVRGNVDTEPWALALPETEVIETDPVTIYVLHDVHALDLDPVAAGFRIIVSGHSHKPSRTEHGGVLFLNPGSAGPRRFDLPVTIARLDVSQSPWRFNVIDLTDASSK